MKQPTSLNLSNIETLVFAGGGNRCWWQAGALSSLLGNSWMLPGKLVGTSAGAALAASCLTDGPKAALDSCIHLYSKNEHVFDWSGLSKFRFSFAHQNIYPTWIESFVNSDNYTTLLASDIQLYIGITRPAKMLGLTGSVAVGTLAYIIDKYLWNSIHPRLPKVLGLRQEFIEINTCENATEAQKLLGAAAAAPPLLPSHRIGNSFALDGGYSDNAPIHQQTEDERSKTLVLLTRHYSDLPTLFCRRRRIYWQPSRKVPVSTWDCTYRTTVQEAFALGEKDAKSAMNAGILSVA